MAGWKTKAAGLTALVGTLGLGMVPLGQQEPAPALQPDAAVAIDASNEQQARYLLWKAQHESLGGDRNVVVAFGFAKGLTNVSVHATGYVKLNLIEGLVESTAEGLPAGEWDLWLIDNATGASAGVEQSDTLKRVGSFDVHGRLTAELGSKAFARFNVDSVVVAPRGAHPATSLVAFGQPRTFQRLYSLARTGQLESYLAKLPKEASDSILASLQSKAHAAIITTPEELVDPLVAYGARIFNEETFAGNGRTCATCHPGSNNFALDPAFISTLPPTDPLFVHEFTPALANLEHAVSLRENALILENVDGFDKPGVLRSVNHLLALSTSLSPPKCVDPAGCQAGPAFFAYNEVAPIIDISNPESSGYSYISPGVAYPIEKTGWGGDGAPGDGSLRSFSTGAVIQHFTKRLNRVAGTDFRLPTDAELDALELFQLSLGRQQDFDFEHMNFKNAAVQAGRDIFFRVDTDHGTKQAGKCTLCHEDGGANGTPEHFGQVIARFGISPNFSGNQLFATNIERIENNPAAIDVPGVVSSHDSGFGIKPLADGACLVGRFVPTPGGPPSFVPGNQMDSPKGFGIAAQTPFLPPNLCQVMFNVPPLVEAADTAPFFHHNGAATLFDAIAFYTSPEFNDEPLIELFVEQQDTGGIGIQLTDASINKVAKFMTAINALENLRMARKFLVSARNHVGASEETGVSLLARAADELNDVDQVLSFVSLHEAMREGKLASAIEHTETAQDVWNQPIARILRIQAAIEKVDQAREVIID
jgi:cytochrome c peroxidase